MLSEKNHKTVVFDNLKEYPKEEKIKLISSIFRTNESDLWVQGSLMIENFKNNLQ